MNFKNAAAGLALAITMSPIFTASAVAQQSANQNDVDTSIALLGKNNSTFTDSQKNTIYKDSVRAFLDNIGKNHPDLLPEMTDYFNSPIAEYNGESRGFHNYKASIEHLLADGSDVSKINAITVISAQGVAYHKSLAVATTTASNAPPSPKVGGR